MAIKLKDIPFEPVNNNELEALSNKTFDYADRNNVSLREARVRIREQAASETKFSQINEVNKVFGLDIPNVPPPIRQGELIQGYGDFTFSEKAIQIGGSVQRGASAVVKVPGIALKAIGEQAMTREQLEKLRIEKPSVAKMTDNPTSRTIRGGLNMLRKAGNKYIDILNEQSFQESPESRGVRGGSFLASPFYRTATAVGESAPSYGLAVVASVTTANPATGLAILGTTSAASSYEKLRGMNVNPDLALIGATLEGSIEVLTEKVPMDILMKGGGRPLLIRALKLGTAESFQELLANLGQNYVSAVVKDIDPENYGTALAAARQEWGIITEGWEDSMAAGYFMGAGSSGLSPSPDFGRNADQLRQEYGFVPRNTNELLNLHQQVRQHVKAVEKRAQAAAKAETQAEPPVTGEATIEATDEPTDILEAAPPVREKIATKLTRKELQAQAKELGIKANQSTKALEEQISHTRVVPTKEIGEGEEKVRGSSVSTMARAIEDGLVEDNAQELEDLPTYKQMNMKVQAEKSLALIEADLEQAKRVAFYQEASPDPDLYPENVFSALNVYATMTEDIDLLMDLAFNEDAVREHTIAGKRIKSLDTGQDNANPVNAIKEVVVARKEKMIRDNKDIAALEAKLKSLGDKVNKAKKSVGEFTDKVKQRYGARNTLVTQEAYNGIIDRRNKEVSLLPHSRARGAAYVPNAQDFIDIAKIATFHLEAMGRDFGKWSHQMTKDFGEWIAPHLRKEYDKALAEAATAGVEIKEAKRLTTKKKRLATTTKKIKGKLEGFDLTKDPRIPIELDAEGEKLQAAYDSARDQLKAAQAAAEIITEEEVATIAKLGKDVAERKAVMLTSKRRAEGEGATKTEAAYGTTMFVYKEYVDGLKSEANKKTVTQKAKEYLDNPVDILTDVFGIMKSLKATWDNSFIGRQGRRTFLKGVTGDIKSAKIWWKTFFRSFKVMWQTLKREKVRAALFAEIVSDPDYELLKRSGLALNVIEEDIPTQIPEKIPFLGITFEIADNAFTESAKYMRYHLGKQYLSIWRKSGKVLSKQELLSIGNLSNSQTGRGSGASVGILNNIFWSPGNLRAHVDTLTAHVFDKGVSGYAKYQAAKNLLRYISGAAMILALADWIDDDSVTWDTNSSDFGKIKIGNTRFSVGGGMEVLIVLTSRLATRSFTSSTTGETKSIDSNRFGATSGKDLIFSFLENKLSPAASMAVALADQKTWSGDQLTIPQMINDGLSPLIVQQVMESGDSEDAANVLAVLIAEALGVNVQTYTGKTKKSKADWEL